MKNINAVRVMDLKNGKGSGQNAVELKKAVINFEALFINQMLQEMRNTIQKSGLLHGAPGEDIYTSLFDAELSKLMASSGAVGLENMLLKQLNTEFHAKEDLPELLNGEDDKLGSDRDVPAAAGNAATGTKKFRFPMHGKVSSGYGLRKDPFTGHLRFHRGLDITAPEGSPVYPASVGKVIFSGKKAGYGNIIEVIHDGGYVTKYAHNKENLVERGDTVTTSDVIAYVGSTGGSTGPHLHFEVIKNGASIDPRILPYG